MTKREAKAVEIDRKVRRVVFDNMCALTDEELLVTEHCQSILRAMQWQAEQSAMAGRRSDGYEIEKAFEEAMMNAGTEEI